jgi:hypothetical protein
MEKEKLKRKLEVIQDLKSRYYIGTQEAWDYLNAVDAVYSLPVEISDKINHEVNPTKYPATPQRVCGLLGTISEICYNALNASIDKQNSPDEIDSNWLPGPIFSEQYKNLEIIGDQSGWAFRLNDKKVIRVLVPFFKDAQSRGITSNREFGGLFIDKLKQGYNLIDSKIIEEDLRAISGFYLDEIVKNLSLIDWEQKLSKENLRKIESDKLFFEEQWCLNCESIIRRILLDQVDHRLEYRREVLCKWLTDNNIEDYQEALDKVQLSIKHRQDNIEQFKELSSIHPSIWLAGEAEERLKHAVFIRHLLGSDKNFIERYLRN